MFALRRATTVDPRRLRQRALAAIGVVAVAACTGDAVTTKLPPLAFPAGFLWGTAIAGFQADMGCPTPDYPGCVDAHSDWYQFVTDPRTRDDASTHVAGDDPAVVGPGFWELYAADADRAANELHNNALRLSIEWSRIFPNATTTIAAGDWSALAAAADASAVAHYHEIFAALRARGLQPLVTLNHYTLPLWIHDGAACHENLDDCHPRGWVDAATTVAEIAKYAGFVAHEFGGEVDLWATENEPFAVLLPGYLQPTAERSNPPAVAFRAAAARTVFAALIEGHARMVDAVRAADTRDADGDGAAQQVGLVYAMAPVLPLDAERDLDRQAAENVFYLWNLAFLDAVALGQFDGDLDGAATHRDDLAGRLDWLGINYYVAARVRGLAASILPDLSALATFDPSRVVTNEIYPRGIYEMATLAAERYHVPIYITENDGQRIPRGDEQAEIGIIVQNLQWLWAAINGGADVRGYFYWTLVDNYEWNHAIVPYGLYGIDPEDPTKARTARATVAAYGRIAAANGIPADMRAQWPVTSPIAE